MRRTAPFWLIGIGLVLSGLAGCGDDDPTPSPSNPISSALDGATQRLRCYANFEPLGDCDQDGVSNAVDVIPGRADNADDDSDSVPNRLDRFPGLDDRRFDSDSDGTADYLDTFFGNNLEDADRDGLLNGFDPQPYSPPPGGQAVRPPTTISNEELANDILRHQMARKFSDQLFGPRPDEDLDGIPDDQDTTPTQFTNDRDNDGDPDFYDPRPGDASLDSRNDPYDPRNDEYWERDPYEDY